VTADPEQRPVPGRGETPPTGSAAEQRPVPRRGETPPGGAAEQTGQPRAIALVTGAAGHVGQALVTQLQRRGCATIGVDRPGARPAHADDRHVPGRRPATPRWVATDLAAPVSEVELRAALADVSRLDLVVAAAGVTALGSFAATDDEAFRRVMDVNYHGAVRTARATLPALAAPGGLLVVVSSVAGLVPVAGRPAYVGAKHAVSGTFLALAAELRRDDVTVSVVHPTFLATPVTEVGAAAPRTTTGAALDADGVARAIVRLAARHRAGRRVPARVLLGRTAHLADVAARLSPALARGLAARTLHAG
jgi:NAD(P)-dependent dehydrogenase (short-subunit alcohol dehydrogenase family)